MTQHHSACILKNDQKANEKVGKAKVEKPEIRGQSSEDAKSPSKFANANIIR